MGPTFGRGGCRSGSHLFRGDNLERVCRMMSVCRGENWITGNKEEPKNERSNCQERDEENQERWVTDLKKGEGIKKQLSYIQFFKDLLMNLTSPRVEGN